METIVSSDESSEVVNRYSLLLHKLLSDAAADGVIITVETESLEPLAMRNVRMVGHVRGAR